MWDLSAYGYLSSVAIQVWKPGRRDKSRHQSLDLSSGLWSPSPCQNKGTLELDLSDRAIVSRHEALGSITSTKEKKKLWDLGSLTRSAGSESQVTFKLVLFKVPSHVEFDLPRTDFM